MTEFFKRTEALIGDEALQKLNNSHVAVFGVGGVGGYIVEALARGGIGEITLIDNDTIKESNINRQIIALSSTIGEKKTEAFEKRLKDINPEIKVNLCDMFVLPDDRCPPWWRIVCVTSPSGSCNRL